MAMQFSKATKKQARLRLALIGVSGSGKTYTALTLARELGERVAVIDTERGSASKYADLFAFDVLELETYSPTTYVEAIKAAEAAGYQVIVIDSLSHAWMGKDGALEQVDRAAAASRSGNSYVSWRTVTPQHNALVDAMLQTRCHVIATMRAKSDFVEEVNEKTGKKGYRKVGLAPIQRDGMEYEFDLVGDMDLDNNLIISKTRCPALHGAVISKPGASLAETLRAWLTDGVPVTEPAPTNGNSKAPAQQLAEIGFPPKEPPAQPETPPAAITLETAMALTTSDGDSYGDLTSDELADKSEKIVFALRRKDLSDERRADLKLRVDAIGLILKTRAAHTPA